MSEQILYFKPERSTVVYKGPRYHQCSRKNFPVYLS